MSQRYIKQGQPALWGLRFTCLLSICGCLLSVALCWCQLRVVTRVWQRKSKHTSYKRSAPSTGLRLVRSNSPASMHENMSSSLVQKAGLVTWVTGKSHRAAASENGSQTQKTRPVPVSLPPFHRTKDTSLPSVDHSIG